MQVAKNVNVRNGTRNDSRGILVRPGAFSHCYPLFYFTLPSRILDGN
jgi:hypothetical protein